jgi:hypothetical protein
MPDYENEEDVMLVFVSPNSVDVKRLFKGHKTLELKENYGLDAGLHIGTLLKKNLDDITASSNYADEDDDDDDKDSKVYTLENLPIKKAVFIDSTWLQCRGIYKDPRISNLNCIIIQNRITRFWRKQKDSPEWFLATIEAIHQLCIEVHVAAFGIDKIYYDTCLQDLKLLKTNWIPKKKIIAQPSEKNEGYNSLTIPYNGQYDNLLFYFAFTYSLIHSLDDPNSTLKT